MSKHARPSVSASAWYLFIFLQILTYLFNTFNYPRAISEGCARLQSPTQHELSYCFTDCACDTASKSLLQGSVFLVAASALSCTVAAAPVPIQELVQGNLQDHGAGSQVRAVDQLVQQPPMKMNVVGAEPQRPLPSVQIR